MSIHRRVRAVRAFGFVVALATALTATVLGTPGCATPAAVAGRSTANLTAPGIQALHGKEAVKYLDIIRDLGIAAEAAKKIPTATAERIVRWHRAAIQTIDQTPNGWKPSVLTGLDQLQRSLTPEEHAIFDPYILSARTLIQAVIA